MAPSPPVSETAATATQTAAFTPMAILDWFAGNGQYMDLRHCMGGDTFWIIATVVLDLVVAAGYILIALHWNQNQQSLTNPQTRVAMGRLRNIFLLCGLCGYVFIPIKMVWPAWRLYDMAMVALAYTTWRYAWGAKDLKVVYRELRRSQSLAHELDESRAESMRKSFFLNAVSHDLKNPLYALSLQAHVIEGSIDDDDPEAARDAIAAVQQCVTDVNRLLDHFLELGRLEWRESTLHTERFPLDKLLQEVVCPLSVLAQNKGLTLSADVSREGGGLMLETDRGRLERVVMNLVSNAIKYTDHGRVDVTATPVPLNGEPAGRRRGGNGRGMDAVRIDVTDTGRGIEPEMLDRLFEDFFQADNPERDRAKGFGLGLSIAKRLVESLGGWVEVDSDPGRGSRFSVVVPLRLDLNEDATPAAQDTASSNGIAFTDRRPQSRTHADSLVTSDA